MRAISALLKNRRRISVFKRWVRVPLVAAIFIATSLLIDFPKGSQHWSSDLVMKYIFPEQLQTQHPRIVLVEISNRTLNRIPYASPIDRTILSKLIKTIDAAKPAVIGMDLIFDRHTEESKDAELVRTIKDMNSKIVLGAVDGRALSPEERKYQSNFIAQVCRPVGHLHLGDAPGSPFEVSDLVIRKTVDSASLEGAPSSFANQVATSVSGRSAGKSGYIIWLRPPTNGTETFLTLSAETVIELANQASPAVPLGAMLSDKIVLIGGNFPDRDKHLTPLSVWSDERFNGLYVHAQILHQILAGKTMVALEEWYWQIPICFVAMIVGFVVGGRGRDEKLHNNIELAATLVVLAICYLLAWLAGVMLPFASIVLIFLAFFAAGRSFEPARAIKRGRRSRRQ